MEHINPFSTKLEQIDYKGFDIRLRPANAEGMREVTLSRDGAVLEATIDAHTGECLTRVLIDPGYGYKPSNILEEWAAQAPELIKEIIQPLEEQRELPLEDDFEEMGTTPGRRANFKKGLNGY